MNLKELIKKRFVDRETGLVLIDIKTLKRWEADLEAIIDMCGKLQREIEAGLNPRPYRPSDPEARTIVNMGDLNEAQIGAKEE